MIDWDAEAQEAERSPRGIISEWLGREDEIEMIAVVVVDKKNTIHTGWSWKGEKSSLYIIGMLESAKAAILKAQVDEP